jgi:hypothetical protein
MANCIAIRLNWPTVYRGVEQRYLNPRFYLQLAVTDAWIRDRARSSHCLCSQVRFKSRPFSNEKVLLLTL